MYYKDGVADTRRELDIVCGDGKANRLVAAFEGRQVDWSGSVAYADSYSDLPILHLVGHPVAVCPDKDLAAVLPELGWRVMED
jgi:phosphoserine phosphatase